MGHSATKCDAHKDVNTPQIARSVNADHANTAATTGADCATSVARSTRSSARSSGTVRIDGWRAYGSAATTVPRASQMAVPSTYADWLKRIAMLPSAQSGTQRKRRNGAIAIADVHPRCRANEPAIVRRSSVCERVPMRSRSAWKGPPIASRNWSPAIQPAPVGRPTSTAQPAWSARSLSYISATGDRSRSFTQRHWTQLGSGRARALRMFVESGERVGLAPPRGGDRIEPLPHAHQHGFRLRIDGAVAFKLCVRWPAERNRGVDADAAV